MANNKIVNKLKALYGIASTSDSNSGQKTIVPGFYDREKGKVSPVNFKNDEILKLYKMWLQDSFMDSQNLKNRLERNASLKYAYYNNAIFSKMVNLYAQEAIQPSIDSEPIEINAKSNIRKYIQDFLTRLGINSNMLKDTAFNIVLHGDSFWALSIDDKLGYTGVNPLDVDVIKDRIEFNAFSLASQKNLVRQKMNAYSKNEKIKKLLQVLDDTNTDNSQLFNSYLFGFEVGTDIYLPPWNMLHFRNFTTLNEFQPFGRPIVIHCLAPFYQLQTQKNLMAIARAVSFPIKKIEVETDENMDQSDQWEVVNEAREEFHNLGQDVTTKEQFAVNSEVWTPSGLINIEFVENRMDLDKIADVEMLRDDLIMATDIPKGYLIVDRSSFGTSGQSLLAQHKPFARSVYQVQSAILEQLVELIKLQMVITGQFEGYDTKFELSLPYPAMEESSDRIRQKNDLLRLAKDVAETIGGAIGLDRDESLPPDVVKDIFKQITFFDDDDIDKWIDNTMKAKEEKGDEDDGGGFGKQFNSFPSEKRKRIESKVRNRLNNELIEETYFNLKSDSSYKNLQECHVAGKHFYNSAKNNTPNHIIDILKNSSKDKKKL